MVRKHIQQWFSDGRAELFFWVLLFVGIINLLVLLIWSQSLFTALRLRFNDLYFVESPVQNNIVIVAIDDASLEAYGSTPAQWSRSVFADFLAIMREAQPRVVALDLLFSGAESADELFIESVNRLRQNDILTQVVVAGAGVNQQTQQLSQTDISSLSFANELPLIAELETSTNYVGFTNAIADTDGIVRRQPSIIFAGGRRQFSFSLATYLAYLRIPAVAAGQVINIEPNQLTLPDGTSIQIDQLGFWQQNYFGAPGDRFPTYSFLEVMNEDVELEKFAEKTVLVGVKEATGNLDSYAVPSATSGELMSGIEIQAHALESILQNKTVIHPSTITNALLITATVWLSAVSMLFIRWYLKLGVAVIWMISLIIVGSVLFSSQQFVLNLFDPFIAIILVLLVLIGFDISFEAMRRRQTEFVLESVQQIAQQRLNLERALPLVKDDIRQLIASVRQIDVVMADAASNPKQCSVVQQVMSKQQLVEETGVVGIPFVWQGAIQIVLVIQHTAQKLSRRQRQRLSNFVAQLSPSLDNIALYQDLQQQKQLVDTIYAESPVGFALMNYQGHIQSHNQYLVSLLALENSDIAGKSFFDILEQVVENHTALDQIIEGSTKREAIFTNITVGEKSANVAIVNLPEYKLQVVVLSDTSTLTELNRLKTEMLRMASHDLKNPLSRIIGFTELINIIGDPLTETQKEYLDYIFASSGEMLRIIEDVLALERLRSNELIFETIDFGKVVEQVCLSLQPDTIRKQQQFAYEAPSGTISVRGNTSQLSQSITNLVGNAIKYTPEMGHITVRLTHDAKTARLEVEDTGYGIPIEAQDKLFTEFFRAKSDATRNIPGTGLGLSLVKTIISKHGGMVGFQSEEGKGSIFWIELPSVEQ